MPAAVVEFMEELVTQPRRQHSFHCSPEAYVADSALSSTEREAAVSGDVVRMRALLAEHSPVKEMQGALIFLVVIASDDDESNEGAANA